MDIEPIKLKPTWRNNICGDGGVAKRLDRFLVTDQVVDKIHYLREWVGCGGISNHLPIFLELRNGPTQPPSPLKFNKTWLKDESFTQLLTNLWIPFNNEGVQNVAFQFADNIKRVKGDIKVWAVGER